MVCMRLAAVGLPEAELPDAWTSGTPGTAVDWSSGSSLPSKMTSKRRGMVESRRRKTLLTRWAAGTPRETAAKSLK